MKRKTSNARARTKPPQKTSATATKRSRLASRAPADLYHSIAAILRAARANAYRAVNFTMVEAYWNIGRTIVEDEQRGETRAGYGTQLMRRLSDRLCAEFGKGFSVQSLWNMRQFYQCFPIISAVRRELTWSHYKALIRVESEVARKYYADEVANQN